MAVIPVSSLMGDREALRRARASLLSSGSILVRPGTMLSSLPTKSTTGPTAPAPHLLLDLGGGESVAVRVVRDLGLSPFELVETDGRPAVYRVVRGGALLMDGVRITPAPLHAPGQAFINLDSRCVYSCRFCVSPGLDLERYRPIEVARWVEIVLDAWRRGTIDAVAATTGVWPSLEGSILRMEEFVRAVRAAAGEVLPIGVEPLVTTRSQIERLRRAGATELKVNIQAATRELYDAVCPGLRYDRVFELLQDGVEIFGRGRVCSNLLIGIGETDEQVMGLVERLARMGVAPNLRLLRNGPEVEGPLREALGENPEPVVPERMVRLRERVDQLLDAEGIDPLVFRTMCHRCRACDL